MNQLEAQNFPTCFRWLSLGGHFTGRGSLTTNLFSHAEWQKPKDKLAAGTTNTPFQFGIEPIRDLKEHPKLTLIISTGAFQPGVKGGPQIKCYTRDQWAGPSTPNKCTHGVNSDTFVDQKCGHSCVNLSSFIFFLRFDVFFFNNTSSLHSNGWTLFLLWLKLHLIVCVTGALSYQGPLHPQRSKGGGAFHQSSGEMDSTTVD